MLKLGILGLIALVLIAAAIIRFRPLDPAKWHVEDFASLVTKGADGRFCVARDGDMPPSDFPILSVDKVGEQLHEIVMATPRTKLLAGSLASDSDGAGGTLSFRSSATYVTRSAIWGFPDVTTVVVELTNMGSAASACGRLVYGRKDFGVNRARITGWLAQLDGLRDEMDVPKT